MDYYINDLIEKIEHTQFTSGNRVTIDPYSFGIKKLVEIFSDIKTSGKKVFFIGNGGSAAIAMHMTADFMKNGGMNTYSLYDGSVITCMGNDYGYEYIFSKQLHSLMGEGDLLVAISSSGKSKNIVNAVDIAKGKKAVVITFTGFDADNEVRSKGTFNVYVPCSRYGMVESIHNIILQQVVDMILERDGGSF